MGAFNKLLFATLFGAAILSPLALAQTAAPFQEASRNEPILEAGLMGGAEQRILHSGASSAINSYIANAVHIDVGTGVIPTAQPGVVITAASTWTTGSSSLTFTSASGCAGIQPGATILTPGLGEMGSVNQTLAWVLSCTGSSSPYTLSFANATGSAGSPYRGGGSPQILLVTTNMASADSCHMVFSGWMRGNYTTYTNALTTNYFKDTYGGIRGPTGSSAEQTYGINLASDANGIRINMNNSAVLAGASTLNTLQETINTASIPSYFNANRWNHILISANTCDWSGAVGSSPAKALGSASSRQYEEVYINGVQAIGAAATFNWSATNGINFSNPGSGFSLNMGSQGDGTAVNDWADVELWTSIDLICGAPSTSASYCASGNTISAHDLANFIDANGRPVSPSVRTAAYGLPTTRFTGSDATFASNAGTGASTAANALMPSTGVINTSLGGVTNISSSPSYANAKVAAQNPSGQPPGTVGFKWICNIGGGSMSGTCNCSGPGLCRA